MDISEKYKEYFKDKKITVMGLGLLGRGVGDTSFLAECGAELIVTDLKTEGELKESIDKLSEHKNITYTLGGHKKEDFKGRDLILQAAGIPYDSEFLNVAREDGAKIAMSGTLFAQLSGIPIIGVTGTRGKSTVTHMIHHVISQLTEGGEVILGGNVRGVSNLQLLKNVQEDSIAVMELDSWQLQGFGYENISPQVAVFTNFMEDHMNYYKGDMGKYFRDKSQIFEHQEGDCVLITTQEVFEQAQLYMKSLEKELHQEVKLVDSSILPEDCLLKMPGEHNRLNAAFALEALRSTGLTDEEIFYGLTTFPGVPGRLEYLGETDLGVKVYNDNNSTTPAATIVAMQGVGEPEKKNVVLILGGDDKFIDMTDMINEIPKWCSKVVMFKERGTERIRDELFALQDQGVDVYEEEGLDDTVSKAFSVATKGEVLVYSPGFFSFGKYFKNEFDRGDQFVELVKKYGDI